MKYKVGDKVRIKSREWYEDNCNRYGIVECGDYEFFEPMNEYCGEVVTITRIDDCYRVNIDTGAFCWTEEMIEGLVEDEMSLDKAGQITDFEYEGLTYTLPDGYQFVDENGNVINATKIVLEKKKKEYPKTYEECCKILDWNHRDYDRVGYKSELLCKLQVLLLCRDAYWQIAGEEMGLGKPWKPDWAMYSGLKHCIIYSDNQIKWQGKHFVTEAKVLAFPTAEMRDEFYENFKKEIEICKELL